MRLDERVEKMRDKYQRRVQGSLDQHHYDFGAAELRDLFDDLLKYLRAPPMLQYALEGDIPVADLRPGYIVYQKGETRRVEPLDP